MRREIPPRLRLVLLLGSLLVRPCYAEIVETDVCIYGGTACGVTAAVEVARQGKSGNVIHSKIFIDATYEGDLMAMAGVSYRVGREANALYQETLNGIRGKTPKNQICGGVDPYVIPGDPTSGLIRLIQRGRGGIPATAINGFKPTTSAFVLRTLLTIVASWNLPPITTRLATNWLRAEWKRLFRPERSPS